MKTASQIAEEILKMKPYTVLDTVDNLSTGKWFQEHRVKQAILEAIEEAFEEINPNKVIANHALQRESDRDKSYGWNECVSELKSNQSKFLGKE